LSGPDGVWFDTPADSMPDGEHVIGIIAAGGAQQLEGQTGPRGSQILVVLNWFDELKAKVPVH